MSSKTPFLKTLSIAIRGVFEATRQERNLKIQIGIAGLTIAIGAVLQLNWLEWACISLSIGSVLAAELINTAIEELVDFVQPELHESARKAKDFAAAGVLMVACASLIVGMLIFGSHLFG